MKIFTIAANATPWRKLRDIYSAHAEELGIKGDASTIEQWATEKAVETLNRSSFRRYSIAPQTTTLRFAIENGQPLVSILDVEDSYEEVRKKIKQIILEQHLDYLFARSSTLDSILHRMCRGHESKQWHYLQGEKVISILTLSLPETYKLFLKEKELLQFRDFLLSLGEQTKLVPTSTHTTFLYIDQGLERLLA